MSIDRKRPKPGRPRLGEGAGELVALRLSPEMLQRVDEARLVGQRSRSEALRQWLEQGLHQEEKMKSFEELYRRAADSQGVLRFHFKPGIFQPGAFADSVKGYRDEQGQWLDAKVLGFDEFGVLIGANHYEVYIPWANIQQVTRRPLG